MHGVDWASKATVRSYVHSRRRRSFAVCPQWAVMDGRTKRTNKRPFLSFVHCRAHGLLDVLREGSQNFSQFYHLLMCPSLSSLILVKRKRSLLQEVSPQWAVMDGQTKQTNKWLFVLFVHLRSHGLPEVLARKKKDFCSILPPFNVS